MYRAFFAFSPICCNIKEFCSFCFFHSAQLGLL
uniref:Uncharacterized protein n=1 Tax=Rhizophora mucronata TaxID=61149 RepID=A0A2P2QY79_RHIMU